MNKSKRKKAVKTHELLGRVIKSQERQEKILEKHGRTLDEHNRKIKENSTKIGENSTKLEEISMKIDKKHEEVLEVLDSIMNCVTKLEQENLMGVEWLKRHDQRLDKIEAKLNLCKN